MIMIIKQNVIDTKKKDNQNYSFDNNESHNENNCNKGYNNNDTNNDKR